MILVLGRQYLLQGYNVVKLIPFNFSLAVVGPALVRTALPCVRFVRIRTAACFSLELERELHEN